MKADSPKNAALIKQYPFLQEILDINNLLEPLDASGRNSSDNVTIKVEKADGDLLWRKGHNTGLEGDTSYIFAMDGKHKNQVAKVGERVFVTNDHRCLGSVSWPRNHEKGRGKPTKYAWSALWETHNFDGSFTNPFPEEKINCMVWVTVQTWHKDTGDNSRAGSRFGELIEREMTITVYTKPKEGFHKLHEESWFGNHICLDSNMHVRALFQKDTDILDLFGRLSELCQLFQDEVYFAGMKEAFEKGPGRGFRGIFGSTEVLVAEMCGYHRVMLQNGSCWISFQLRPGATGMYVLGMNGTLPQLRTLVKTVVRKWMMEPGSHALFQPDKEVGVL